MNLPDKNQSVESLAHRGAELDRLARYDEAADAFRQAIAIQPDLATLHVNLGSTLRHAGKNAEAASEYREAIRLDPKRADAHMYLAMVLRELGQSEQAHNHAREAVRLAPSSAHAWHNLGNIARDLHDLDQAVEAHQKAVALQPEAAEPYFGLGNDLIDAGLFVRAADAYAAAIERRPDYAEAFDHLGLALHGQGLLADAIASFDRAIARRSDLRFTHSNRLYALHGALDARAVADEHFRWGKAVDAAIERCAAYDNDRNPERRLRVGFVSGDLREHPVGRFIAPVFAAHDRSAMEFVCYYNHVAETKLTGALRGYADEWHNIHAMSDAAVVDLIRRHRIDILVDLSGHSARNRLMVFARKPAPVQVAYLGYPNTTGLPAMDYRLTDALSDPPDETESLHSETLIRLPGGFLSYRVPEDAPPIAPPPVLRSGRVTFGSFNKLHKIVPQSLEVWCKILNEIGDSRMMLKADGLGEEATRRRIERYFTDRGISADRLIMTPANQTYVDHLNAYANVDIALDPFPYHGTTTTCEALGMGVPLIALAGDTHISRVGVSLLTRAGFAHWIAQSKEEYVSLAINLAKDFQSLADIRASMRARLARSALAEGNRLTREIELAFREIWRRWCAS